MTPSQCQVARELLGWSRERLYSFSEVSIGYITKFETTGEISRERAAAIQNAFEAAGLVFTHQTDGCGGVMFSAGQRFAKVRFRPLRRSAGGSKPKSRSLFAPLETHARPDGYLPKAK